MATARVSLDNVNEFKNAIMPMLDTAEQVAATAEDVNEIIADVNKHIGMIDGKISLCKKKTQDINKQIGPLKEQIEPLQYKIEREKNYLSQLKSELSSAKYGQDPDEEEDPQISRLESRIADTSSEVSSLNSKLSSLNSQISSLQSKKAALENAVRKAEVTKDKLKTGVDKLSQRSESVNDANTAIKTKSDNAINGLNNIINIVQQYQSMTFSIGSTSSAAVSSMSWSSPMTDYSSDVMIDKYGSIDIMTDWKKREVPFTREEGLSRVNPRYDYGEKYTVNCQRCVPTYEMVRRGYDVTVFPKENEHDYLAVRPEKIWRKPHVINASKKDCENTINDEMLKWGNGARAQICFGWDGMAFTGHTIMAECVNGKIYYIDPQTNTISDKYVFDEMKEDTIRFWRVDNLEPSDYIKRCCRAVGEQDVWWNKYDVANDDDKPSGSNDSTGNDTSSLGASDSSSTSDKGAKPASPLKTLERSNDREEQSKTSTYERLKQEMLRRKEEQLAKEDEEKRRKEAQRIMMLHQFFVRREEERRRAAEEKKREEDKKDRGGMSR